jgi:peptidyl-prolyl cis-trans isomerase SurA
MQGLSKFVVAVTVWILASASGAWAQDASRAAAVVNDEIVSMLDVAQRTKLAILSAGLKDSPELRQRLISQVVRGLIDERLQAQEAKRLDIEISDEQIDLAIADIARQNNMQRDQFEKVLVDRGVILDSFIDQIRAQLTWQTLITRRLRPSAQVSDEEVADVAARIRAGEGATLRLISEIFLSVDNPNQDEEVRRNAERIFDQLAAKAEFAPLARQFSESASAARGGDIGWIQKGQLAEELDRTLELMQPGQVSRPIRTLAGYHIIWFRDQRRNEESDATLELKQILFALPENTDTATRERVTTLARETKAKITGCAAVDDLAASVGSPGSGDLGKVSLKDLPQPIREAVSPLAEGQVSEPILVPNGLSLLVVCGRDDGGIDRERIRQRLLDERLSILARRFMRDLRRDANVDIRI